MPAADAINVLVVEDEPLLRFDVVERLTEAGFTTLEAGSGDEAAVYLSDPAIDAVVTDINMPGKINGVGLCKLAVSFRPDIFVAVLTSYERPDDLPAKALHFTKPYSDQDLARLIDAVRQWCVTRRTSPAS